MNALVWEVDAIMRNLAEPTLARGEVVSKGLHP